MVARHIHVSYHLLQVFFCIDNDSLSLPFTLSLSLSFSSFFLHSIHFVLFFLPSFPSPTLLPPLEGAGLGIERKEKGVGKGRGRREGAERSCLCIKPQGQNLVSQSPLPSSTFLSLLLNTDMAGQCAVQWDREWCFSM